MIRTLNSSDSESMRCFKPWISCGIDAVRSVGDFEHESPDFVEKRLIAATP